MSPSWSRVVKFKTGRLLDRTAHPICVMRSRFLAPFLTLWCHLKSTLLSGLKFNSLKTLKNGMPYLNRLYFVQFKKTFHYHLCEIERSKALRIRDQYLGPWLWRSWQNGSFWHQRSVVRIPTLAKFFEFNRAYLSITIRKDKNKEKEARIGPFY